MNKITFPLSRRTQGASVLDLQNALLALLERQSLLASDEPIRRELTGVLRGEASVPTYGDATTRVVATFQRERRLPPSGEVDGPTADAINKLLRELGLLDAERPTPRLVAGVLRREDGRALSGARIVAVHVAAEVVHDDLRPFARKEQRVLATEAATGTGDDRDASVECTHHGFPCSGPQCGLPNVSSTVVVSDSPTSSFAKCCRAFATSSWT